MTTMKIFARVSANVEPPQNLCVSNKLVKKLNKTAIELLAENQNYKAMRYEVMLSALELLLIFGHVRSVRL